MALAGQVAVLYLAACPQFARDDFEKGANPQGAGGNMETTSAPTGNSTLGIIVDGVGGKQGASVGTSGTNAGADATGGSMSGAAGDGAASGNASSGGTGGTATDGSAGAPEVTSMPTTLVYSDNLGSVHGSAWNGAAFGAPVLWNETETEVAFVEARMAPDRSWGLAAYQAEESGACTLWVQQFVGAVAEPPSEIVMGEADSCLTARSFDIGFEQQSGRALLVYGIEGGGVEYRSIERESMSPPQTARVASGTDLVNWVRLVEDFTTNRISAGYSLEGVLVDSLELLEWDGNSFTPAYQVAASSCIIDSQSFDFAYYQGNLLALRGHSTGYGFRYRIRDKAGVWSPESAQSAALDGNAQLIEVQPLPSGIAGVLYDAAGSQASFGAIFWQAGTFTEESPLDAALPPLSSFERPALKADIARLGNAAVAVYTDDYEGPSGTGCGLGWAVKRAEGTWELQQELLPLPFDQESDNAVATSIRLARFEADVEGLVLVFGEDRGLFATSLSDLTTGWAEPRLVDENVQSADTTPFSIAEPP